MLKAWGLKKIFLMKSRYAGKDCSTEQEKCSNNLFKAFVRVGEKQRICGWPTTELRLKRISPFYFLQAITILYIGGASGTSSLLTCQESDGNQDASAMLRCSLIFFFRFWALFALRVSSFVSCSCPLCVFCLKVHEDWPFTKCKTTSPGPMRSLELFIFHDLFGYTRFEICRFESPFWMPRCCPKIPISGAPSSRLHLPISHTCHPVYGAHEDEVLGGYHWLCLRVWLRHCDSYIYTLPLSPAACSATFQPNDHSICHLWRWSESFLAWSQRLYHGENLATGQGCFCLSDCCIWVAFRILSLNVDFTSSLWGGPRK